MESEATDLHLPRSQLPANESLDILGLSMAAYILQLASAAKHCRTNNASCVKARQEPQDSIIIVSGRQLTIAAEMAGRGAGVEGMG